MSAAAQASDPHVSSSTRRLLVAALLPLFAIQVMFTARQMSPAYDEVAILPARYAFLKTGQWQLLATNALVRARGYFGTNWLKRYPLVDVIGYAPYVFRVS